MILDHQVENLAGLRVAVGVRATLYRVRQFVSALLARVSPDDLREADEVLPPDAKNSYAG